MDDTRHVQLLREALHHTANRLEALAEAHGLASVNEQRHLDPQFRLALRDVIDDHARTDSVTKPSAATLGWPRLGTVDVGIEEEAALVALVELKCGGKTDSLGPCVWDAAKLAYLLQSGTDADAFLVAGTTGANWEAPIRGAELFSDGKHDQAELRTSYADWWRKWEKDGYPAATRMPASFATELADEAAFTVGGAPWLLRMARVRAVGRGWIDWPPLLAGGTTD